MSNITIPKASLPAAGARGSVVRQRGGERYFHHRSRTLYPGETGPAGHIMEMSVCTIPLKRECCAGGSWNTCRGSEHVGPTVLGPVRRLE